MIETSLDTRTMVMGLGVTGLSVARYLHCRNEPFTVWDRAPRQEIQAQFRETFPESSLVLRDPDPQIFESVDTVIVSPGVPLDHPALCAARASGAQVYGDIELFAHEADAPVLGITGSNGKTTTTLLLNALLEAAGMEVRCGGNLGTPALSLLKESAPDVYVLELSSFQLESTETLACQAACLLNLSPDHLDRHGSYAAYRKIKHCLYRRTEVAVYNRDDADTRPGITEGRLISFGLDTPTRGDDFGIREHEGLDWLCKGRHLLLPTRELALPGRHNGANVLAALAMADAHEVDLESVIEVLRVFQGPPHRLQKVDTIKEVEWYNDSKATNLDAMRAALRAFSQPCVLIAGGQCKQDDLSDMCTLLKRRARALVLMGEAADEMALAWQDCAPIYQEPDMEAAVARAAALAQSGDCVLLSPGGASFDQYRDYMARGDHFAACVRQLKEAS